MGRRVDRHLLLHLHMAHSVHRRTNEVRRHLSHTGRHTRYVGGLELLVLLQEFLRDLNTVGDGVEVEGEIEIGLGWGWG